MEKISDLIYAEGHEKDIKKDILAKFPDAKFEDASDDIHAGRFQVEIEGIDRLEWYNWMALEGGFADLSLRFQLSGMSGHLQVAEEDGKKRLVWTEKYRAGK